MAEEKKQVAFTGKYYEAVGRRKTAVARVRLFADGKGRIVVNDQQHSDYLPTATDIKKVEDPLQAAGAATMSVSVKVKGGGVHSQADAIRHGISRALLKVDADNRSTLKPFGWLTRDPRKKERKKPGLKRARRAPQWSKR